MNATAQPWLSARAASMQAGITLNRLLKLAATGQVRTLALPGQNLKFSREDVERLAAERGSDGASS